MPLADKYSQLLELANLYPSPHNGQPVRLKLVDDNTIELYFECQRGLQATDISFIFSFVSMGVFIQHLEYCASALGHRMTYQTKLPDEAALRGDGLLPFAKVQIAWDQAPADEALERSLRFRQTSRKKYTKGLDMAVIGQAKQTAVHADMHVYQLSDKQAAQAIWLNQRAVFDDMFDPSVRQELDHWLRYSAEQKMATKDGLAYDCMELNGSVMKYLVDHPAVLRWPGISSLLKAYYLRTMKDKSSVFYMLAPFGDEQASFRVGQVIMQIWQAVSAAGQYLHPFGTIMSNHQAHQDFLRLAGVNNESRATNYLVFIFRAGSSAEPVKSLRIPYQDHLLLNE